MDEGDQIADRFDQDGVVFLRGAFGAEWIALAGRGIERNIAEPSPFFRELSEDGRSFLSDMWSRRFIPEFERFCLESPAAGLAARILRSDRVRLVQDVWFLKQAGTSVRTPWHHDAVITGPFCSIWVALDATPRAASVEFVRGSHKWGRALMPKSYFEAPRDAATPPRPSVDQFYVEFHAGAGEASGDGDFGEIPDIEADRDGFDIVGWDMAPGDCVIFDARTVHGAPGNCLATPTRRFVTRWVTDEAVLARHGQGVIDTLARSGLELDLQVGQPIRGALFPELHVERT